MEALEQLVIAGLDGLPVGADVEIEVGQRRALQLAQPQFVLAGGAANAGSGSWKDSFGLFGRRTREQAGPDGEDGLRLGKLERAALADLDLDVRTDKKAIKARYHELLKRFHPDLNKGDRGAEAKLQNVIKAYKTLKKAGLA